MATDCKAFGGDPYCFDEPTQGFWKGYCSEYCDLTTNDCATAGAICVTTGLLSGNGLCVQTCTTVADCRPGYECLGDGVSQSMCLPYYCTLDSDCSMFCNADTGMCSQTDENCTNGMDDDGDGLTDCEDLGCKTACAPAVTMACLAAPAAVASNMSDTTAGTNLFAGSCTGGGSHETIYSFTPGLVGDVGTVSVLVTSATGQSVYVRTACDDATTELACVNAAFGGQVARQFEAKGGVPLTIFVDGSKPGAEGPFTLTTAFTSTPALCTAVAAGALGANTADTTGGTTAFNGSCTGTAAEEKAFKFTPATTGTLHLVLASATNMGVYVRTDCNSTATELGCADLKLGGANETLDVPVTAGAPVTIFVDGSAPGEAGPFTLTLSVM